MTAQPTGPTWARWPGRLEVVAVIDGHELFSTTSARLPDEPRLVTPTPSPRARLAPSQTRQREAVGQTPPTEAAGLTYPAAAPGPESTHRRRAQGPGISPASPPS